MNYFASHTDGQIAHLNYAKALFTAPTAVLAMAAGAAFMPFFAALIGQGKHEEFAATVNSTVTRIIAVALLGSAWMIGLAQPLVNVVFRRGALHQADAILIATYFSIFALALFCWASQSIYARAFYAAGNTLTPTIANTIIVILSLPVYATLYRTHGAVGLALASDIGILTQMLTMAVLLDRTKLVPLSGLGWSELARALVTAMISFMALATLRQAHPLFGGLLANLRYILAGTAIWAAICWRAHIARLPTSTTRLRPLLQAQQKQNGPGIIAEAASIFLFVILSVAKNLLLRAKRALRRPRRTIQAR